MGAIALMLVAGAKGSAAGGGGSGALTYTEGAGGSTADFTGFLDWYCVRNGARTQWYKKRGVSFISVPPAYGTNSSSTNSAPLSNSYSSSGFTWPANDADYEGGNASEAAGGGNGVGSQGTVTTNPAGIKQTFPADTTTKKVRVYVVSYGAASVVTATLSDGSAGPASVTTTYTTGNITRYVEFTYQAASAGQTLTVEVLGRNDSGYASGLIASTYGT